MSADRPTKEDWLQALSAQATRAGNPPAANSRKPSNSARKKKRTHIAHSADAMNFELTGEIPEGNAIFAVSKRLHEDEKKLFLEKNGLYHLGKPKDGKVFFPSLLTVGNFFTLSSDKRPFAEVPLYLSFADNKLTQGKLIRGKIDPSSPTSYGQLTSFNLKVWVSVLKLWEEQDYAVMEQTRKGKEPAMVGVIRCSQYALAKAVFPKIKSPGKRDKQLIQDAVMDLRNRPCCLVIPSPERQYSVGVQLIGDATWTKVTAKEAKEESAVTIILSEIITNQFRLKRFLVRSIENLTNLKGELPRLLYLYLEPRLLSIPAGSVYNKNLSDLIDDLGLPFAKWHKFPSQRQKIFDGVIAELNGKLSSKDGFQFELRIERGAKDFKLVAILKTSPKILPEVAQKNGHAELAGRELN